FFTVPLGTIRVEGLGGRFGLMTPRRGVCHADSWVRPEAKAVPTGPSFSPIIRSICATSGPFPMRASPTKNKKIHLAHRVSNLSILTCGIAKDEAGSPQPLGRSPGLRVRGSCDEVATG